VTPCPCTLCPTVTALAARPDCERIRIDGRRTDTGLWQWTVDVVTDDRDAHAYTPDLSSAMQTAAVQLTTDH
jgi:hypothetical protein